MRKLSLALSFIAAVWFACAETRSAETPAPVVAAAAATTDSNASRATAAASSLAYPP